MITVAVAAFLGGVATILLGWMGSGKPFDKRKFGTSLIRAFIAAVVFAIGHEALYPLGVTGLALAFLSGAGVEVGGHRLASVLRKGREK